MTRGARIRRNDLPLAGINLEQVDGKSRTDRVYHQMRDRLMRGIFKPHQRLRISDLSQAFGTSETPVREAIFQLIRDGAVEAKTHSYYRVRKLSVAEYLERREIRLLLQPLAARRALEHITESDIDLLERIHAKLVAAEAAKDYETAVRANFDFHFGLYRLSKMPALIGMIENLWIQHGPMLNYLYPEGHPTYEREHQHVYMLRAMRQRDADALCQGVRDDLIEGGAQVPRASAGTGAARGGGRQMNVVAGKRGHNCLARASGRPCDVRAAGDLAPGAHLRRRPLFLDLLGGGTVRGALLRASAARSEGSGLAGSRPLRAEQGPRGDRALSDPGRSRLLPGRASSTISPAWAALSATTRT